MLEIERQARGPQQGQSASVTKKKDRNWGLGEIQRPLDNASPIRICSSLELDGLHRPYKMSYESFGALRSRKKNLARGNHWLILSPEKFFFFCKGWNKINWWDQEIEKKTTPSPTY